MGDGIFLGGEAEIYAYKHFAEAGESAYAYLALETENDDTPHEVRAAASGCMALGQDLVNNEPNSVLIGIGDSYIHLLEDNTIVVGPGFTTEAIRAVLLGLCTNDFNEPHDLELLTAGLEEPRVVRGPSMPKRKGPVV